ncbi:MAG: hypothetical protein ACLT4C_03700 [Butyricicoccus sp.]
MLPGLSASEQRILTLRLAEDMDYSTISEKLGISRPPAAASTAAHGGTAPNLWKGATTMQDSKQIDELFRLMDDVCENGDAALPALEQYLQTQTDAPEIDTEASLQKFKADHKEFFVKPHRGRRLCYRIFVVAAAVFAAGTVFALATGHNPFDYAAMWGAETFGFYRDDFPVERRKDHLLS